MWSDSRVWFELVYAARASSPALLLLLGWRTRTMSVLFMVGVLSLQNRSIFMGDGGDNVIHLMAIYLVLTRCGQVWSLDARRAGARGERSRAAGDAAAPGPGPGRRRPVVRCSGLAARRSALAGGRLGRHWLVPVLLGPVAGAGAVVGGRPLRAAREPRMLLDIVANLVHNGALLVIMAEVCLIYATAGWYKIQGSRWQDGTALYYPLHLDYFSPWPALSDLLAAQRR